MRNSILLGHMLGFSLLLNTHWKLITSMKTVNFSEQTITLPGRLRHPRFFGRLQSNVFDAVSLFQTNHVVLWNATRELWGLFFVWHHDFFVLRDVYFPHVYHQEQSLPGVLHLKKKHSEFVRMIFYLQLKNTGHADSSTADKSHGKLFSWRLTCCEWTSHST